MDLSDVKVSDEDGLVSRGMTTAAQNIVMKERISIMGVASEIVFRFRIQMLVRRLLDERVFAFVRNTILHLEHSWSMSQMICGHSGKSFRIKCNACLDSGYIMREMSSGNCFRVPRNAWLNSGYMLMVLRASGPGSRGRASSCSPELELHPMVLLTLRQPWRVLHIGQSEASTNQT